MKYNFDISGGVNLKFWKGVELKYDASVNLISKTLLEGDWIPDPATLEIESTKHHLGDGPGNEGILYQKNFTVGDYLSNAKECFLYLTIEGPHYEKPPEIEINSQSIGSIQPFFPNPGDQINPDGSHDYTGAFVIKVNIKSLLTTGVNLFTIKNGRPDDDYWFSNVHLKLTY